MKAIFFDRDHSSPLLMPPQVGLIADSAITSHGRPVFVPDFDNEWIAEFYLAARISRLGKAIAAKFAPRYFDAVTLAMRLVPVTISDDLHAAQRPDSIASLFDNALTPGLWLPAADLSGDGAAVTVTVNELSAPLADIGAVVSEAVATVSRFATIKTGDIIMPCRAVPSVSVRTGSMIKCSLDGHDCLDLKLH